jgi:hypothetical protein
MQPQGLDWQDACEGGAWWLAIPAGDPDDEMPCEMIHDAHAAALIRDGIVQEARRRGFDVIFAQEVCIIRDLARAWEFIGHGRDSASTMRLIAAAHLMLDAQEQ